MFLIYCHQVPKGSNDVFVVFPKFPCQKNQISTKLYPIFFAQNFIIVTYIARLKEKAT